MIGSLDVVIGPLLKSCHLCDCLLPILGLAREANAAYTWWILAAGPLVRVKSSFLVSTVNVRFYIRNTTSSYIINNAIHYTGLIGGSPSNDNGVQVLRNMCKFFCSFCPCISLARTLVDQVSTLLRQWKFWWGKH